MQTKEYTCEVDGKIITAEFTDLADQAGGSVIMRSGNTVVLATAVMSKEAKEGAGWFPLTVDYEERFYASGQILGSRFIKREGRPSDEAILSGRIIDRTIRPIFDQHIRHDIQVVATVLSIAEDDPDTLSVIGSSLALGTSNIPWNGPVSSVRIGKLRGSDAFILNPAYEMRSREDYEFDIVACGKDGKINMIEIGASEITEETAMKALEFASRKIEEIQKFQKNIIFERGKPKQVIPKPEVSDAIKSLFAETIGGRLRETIFSGPGKEKMEMLGKEWKATVKGMLPLEDASLAYEYFENAVNDLLHREAIENDSRPDGRTMDEVRPLFAKAGGISPVLHGSGIFYRGGTHILSALTLGGPGDSQVVDGMEVQTKKRFMHHYNFPPFSVGETGRIGSTNRRMVGHGALAEKALVPILPLKEEFPYTIRIVSEALASNGSTSMGSVCGSTLALMDGGVPIKRPVAGIASGLMMESPTRYKVLTDIQGPEDHHGDMDFKVAGTSEGITAVQMDVKVEGIPLEILAEALTKAREARLKILEVLTKEISEPRKEMNPNAPRILFVKIKPEQIGMVIGTGGKTVNEIREKTGTEIDIEDDGTVYITGKSPGAEEAQGIIAAMTREYAAGDTFEGEVVKIAEFGAFVRIGHNTEGLVHISELAPWRVNKVTDLLKTGDKVPISVKGTDDRGKIKLSVKDANPNFFKKPN